MIVESWRGICCFGCVLYLCLTSPFIGIALAQVSTDAPNELCNISSIRSDVRPDAGGPPTKIRVGFQLVDLTDIDDVKQTITGDFGVLLTWTDKRLQRYEGCVIELGRIWNPRIEFFNSGRLFESSSRAALIGAGGQVSYLQRYYGTIASYHSLHDFPFDRQTITISLFSIDLPESDVQLVVDEDFVGKRDLLNISGWQIEGVAAQIGRMNSEADNADVSRYDFNIVTHRIIGFYVWKIIFPLCLIVAMSWCVFWIAPTQIGEQISLSSMSMLTLIAFIFATTNMVPALGYFTRLDWFILSSTILVFLALLESVATSYYVSKSKEHISIRMDRICRIAFPLIFVVLMVLAFVA